MPLEKCYANTDRELWRERPGDYYADSIHVTKTGSVGINAGGHVIVKPLREWHRAANLFPELVEALKVMYAQAELFNSPDDEVWCDVRDQARAVLAKVSEGAKG